MRLSPGSKGTGPRNIKYACGGDQFMSRSRFMKAPNPFTEDNEPVDYTKVGKGGSMSKLSGETKLEKTVKPRT